MPEHFYDDIIAWVVVTRYNILSFSLSLVIFGITAFDVFILRAIYYNFIFELTRLIMCWSLNVTRILMVIKKIFELSRFDLSQFHYLYLILNSIRFRNNVLAAQWHNSKTLLFYIIVFFYYIKYSQNNLKGISFCLKQNMIV